MDKIIDRNGIRKALNEFKSIENERNALYSDHEYLRLREERKREEAKQLARKKYPNYSYKKYEEAGINLVEQITKNIRAYDNISPEEVFSKRSTFKKMVRLAERV